MGVKFERKKKIIFILRFLYFLDKFLPLTKKIKFKLYLNLEWIFERFSLEYSHFNYNPDGHPIRIYTKEYLLSKITNLDNVLDLGCNEGYMANYLSNTAKFVVGIDYNCKLISKAKKNYIKPNLEFYCEDALVFLRNNKIKFNILILSHILEHLNDPVDFLKTYGPYFNYIYIELPDFDKNYLNHFRKDLNMPLNYSDDDHISEFDRYELLKILKDSNIIIKEATQIYGLHRLWCQTKSQ